jgi:tetratricopeptide (TPR) repeat protein
MCARESLSLYQRLEDERGIAWALRLLGLCAGALENDFERQASLLEQSLALAQELDDKPLMTRAYQNLGRAMTLRGDYAAGAKLGEKGLALARETGDRWVIGYLSYHLGVTAIMQREYARAEVFLLEALAVCRDLKLHVNATKTLGVLGSAARLQKKYGLAASYFQEYLAIGRGIPGFNTFSSPLCELGHVTARQGDPQRAVGYLRESIETARGDRGDIIWALWGFGVVAAGLGRFRRAARLYAAVEQLLETTSWQVIGPPGMEDYLRDTVLAREQLSEADFAAVWPEGRRMSLEEAVAYALEEQKEMP